MLLRNFGKPAPEWIHRATLEECYFFDELWFDRLGEPDAVNGGFLYHRSRVETVVRTHMAEFETLECRDKPPTNATTRLRQNTMKWVREVSVRVEGNVPKTLKELKELTSAEHYYHYSAKGMTQKAGEWFLSDDALLAYLRHYHTNYNELLVLLKNEYSWGSNSLGHQEGYEIIKDKCNEIAERLLEKIREVDGLQRDGVTPGRLRQHYSQQGHGRRFHGGAGRHSLATRRRMPDLW